MKKIVIYDFDGTLTPYPMPKFEILKRCGIKDGVVNSDFMKMLIERSKIEKIDLYEVMYKTYFEIMKKSGFRLLDENFILGYDKVTYNDGVINFLNMLYKNNIDNYLLSSGVKVFLDKLEISSFFKGIYATTFCYDKNGEVSKIKYLMSDKNKVEAIKEILKKNHLKEDDCSNVIYIGDGLTDYYAMEYVINNGGITIFVYSSLQDKDFLLMKEKNVVSFYTKSDYSKGSELEKYIKEHCDI